MLYRTFAIDPVYQTPSRRNSFAALQKPLPLTCGRPIWILFHRHPPPRFVGARPPTAFCIMLTETFIDVPSDPEVMLSTRDALQQVQKTLQNSGAVDRDRTGDLP